MGFKEIKKKDKNIMQGKVKCPNCGSMETIASNVTAGTLGVLSIFCFLASCISIWIPIIGWIATPIFILGAFGCFIGFVITLLGMKYTFYCKSCEKKYKISKSEYIKLSKIN